MKLPALTPHCSRICCLGSLLLVSLAVQSFAQTAPAAAPAKLAKAKVISNYRELLEWVPKDSMPRKGVPLTQAQMDAVNEILAKKLKAEPCTVDMRLVVSDVPIWGGKLQIYSEIPNREGYHIRFFGGFPDTKKPELAKVKIGDKVRVTGKLQIVNYHTLWNEFTLSIVTDPTELAK